MAASSILHLERTYAFVGSAVRRARLSRLFAWGFNTDKVLTINTPTTVTTPTLITSKEWLQLDGDDYITFGIDSQNQLWAWGKDQYSAGVFGNGTQGNIYSSPILIGTNWKEVRVSRYAVLGIKTDNTLWGWGTDVYSIFPRLLTEYAMTYYVATATSIQITSNNSFGEAANTLVLLNDNVLYGFGSNEQCELSIGSAEPVPTPIAVNSSVRSTAVGTDHGAIVKLDGTLWLSGSMLNGAWGNGATGGMGSPFIQNTNMTNCKSVTAGLTNTFVIKNDGTLWFSGKSPDGVSANNRSTFVQVGSDTNWSQITTREQHVLGIRTDGTLWVWGEQQYGRLGTGNATSLSSPVQIGSATNWIRASAGYDYSFAINSANELYGWGANTSGQLGLGHNSHVSTPVRIGTGSWKRISAGLNLSAGIKTDGTMWIWGDLKDLAGVGTPVTTPIAFGTSVTWEDVVASNKVMIALTTDNRIMTCGDNYHGATGAYQTFLTPFQFGTATNWKKLAFKDAQVVAVKTDNTLWNWGWITHTTNTFQPLTTAGYRLSTPVQLGTESAWMDCSARNGTMLALKSPGTLWSWGFRHAKGGLTLANRSTPVQVGTSTTWTALACGTNVSLGIGNGGEIWGWGNPTKREFGTASSTTVSTPVLQQSGAWQRVVMGSEHVLAIKDDQLYAWGLNTSGQVGDGTTTSPHSAPIAIGANSEWSSVFAGANFSYAQKKR